MPAVCLLRGAVVPGHAGDMAVAVVEADVESAMGAAPLEVLLLRPCRMEEQHLYCSVVVG